MQQAMDGFRLLGALLQAVGEGAGIHQGDGAQLRAGLRGALQRGLAKLPAAGQHDQQQAQREQRQQRARAERDADGLVGHGWMPGPRPESRRVAVKSPSSHCAEPRPALSPGKLQAGRRLEWPVATRTGRWRIEDRPTDPSPQGLAPRRHGRRAALPRIRPPRRAFPRRREGQRSQGGVEVPTGGIRDAVVRPSIPGARERPASPLRCRGQQTW